MSQSRRFPAVLLLVGMIALPIMAIAPALADSKDESGDDSERASNAETSDGIIESGTIAPPPGEFTSGLPTYLEHYSRPFVIDHDEVRYTRRYYFHRLLHPEPSDKRWGVGVLAASFAMATRK